MYEFKKGVTSAYYNGVDADTIGTEIDKLIAQKGSLSPEELLTIASDPNHPLHKCYGDWDDAIDARKHRLQVSRGLTTCFVNVTIKPHPDYVGPQNVSVSFKVPDTKKTTKKSYVSVQTSVDEYEDEKFDEAIEILNKFCGKYCIYPKLTPLIDKIKEILKDY